MVSINSISTVNVGATDSRGSAVKEEKLATEQLQLKQADDAAVASVAVREERFLRDPEAPTALANTIAGRLSTLGREQAVQIQANSRPSDVHSLLS